jgi:hypothetical protein
VSTQLHVVFDDWFSTVMSDVEIPEEPPDGWCDLINTSRFQCVFDDTASLDLTDEWLAPDKLAQKRTSEHSQHPSTHNKHDRTKKNGFSRMQVLWLSLRGSGNPT